jgi:CRISPR-associated protein Csh2
MSKTDDTATDDTGIETVSNRSEIVFLFDAVDCNPNGNPLSDANRPRIDTQTNQAIVTDVCLKQYIRREFNHGGLGVYISPPSKTGEDAQTRTNLLWTVLKDTISDFDDPEDIEDGIRDDFYDGAIDVRLFGATLSFKTKNEEDGEDTDDDEALVEAVKKYLPQHIRGPVQFSPGRTMHPVEVNENYNTLSSVIATGKGKKQGGFGLDDHRIKYGYFRFHAIVNENAATHTRLTDQDVRHLDRGVWRGVKNQTNSRAKMGQEPRVYIRVEYKMDNFHLGDLHLDVDLDDSTDENGDQRSKPASELRTIRDACLDITPLCTRLKENSDRIETVHVAVDRAVQARNGDEVGTGDFFIDQVASAVGSDSVEEIDVLTTPAFDPE